MNGIRSKSGLLILSLACAAQIDAGEVTRPAPPPLPPLPSTSTTTTRTVPVRATATTAPAGAVPTTSVRTVPPATPTVAAAVSTTAATTGAVQNIKPVYVPVPPAAAAGAVTNADPNALAFDSKEKEFRAKEGETQAKFTFGLTNVSKVDVVIYSVTTSCGCTAAKLPSQPWTLKPGDHGEVGFTTDLVGKSGSLYKSATINSSAGPFALKVTSHIPPSTSVAGNRNGAMGDRSKNLQIAAADRQAVFRNDCANCHVHPTVGKLGRELYETACGICHDGAHRATFVTNLRTLTKPTNAEYWAQWINNGRDGSLMPAFAKSKGGPLDDDQIKSLVEYLESDFKVETTLLPGANTPPTVVRPARPVTPLATE